MLKKHEIDMTEGVIYKQLLSFFFPLLGSSFFQQLYNTADALIVGRVAGKAALSAVGGSAAAILTIFIHFFINMTGGAAVILSQYFGSKKDKEVSVITHTSILFSLWTGIIVSIVGIVLSPIMLDAIGTPADIYEDSLIYMRIFFIGMAPNLLYNMASSILRAVGDSRRPLIFLIISCMTNIGLDFLFVMGFRMGVAGAAIATVMCQVLSAALSLGALIRTDGSYKLRLSLLRIDPYFLKRALILGIPSGVQSLMYTLSNAIVQAGINSFGTDTISAWTAYGKIDLIYWMLMGSLGISIMTFAGQNYGAGNYNRIKKGVRECIIMTAVLSVVSSIIMIIFARPLFYFFVDDPDVVFIGANTMARLIAPTYITYCLIEVFSGTLRGMGDAVKPLIICGLGICTVRIIWILFVLPKAHSLQMLIACYPISWSLTSVVFLIYYRHKMNCYERKIMVE